MPPREQTPLTRVDAWSAAKTQNFALSTAGELHGVDRLRSPDVFQKRLV